MELHPDQKIRCLLLQTKFSENSYWNYTKACETLGHKAPEPPLGLITIAAILPQHWEFKLLDLNAAGFSQNVWDWADMVCIGGMLPQQSEMLNYIRLAVKDNKYVAVGGPDPSSQPELYKDANALVLGEGESSIPIWLESWRNGEPNGRFLEQEKPDISHSPIPRFDLLKRNDYLQLSIQYSRGCPFNCEFCDIIELYGRKPRSKTPKQITDELQAIYDLGHRGGVVFVDDNFIGNKRLIKNHMLPAVIQWQYKMHYPFFFHTEASLNLADDKKLLRQMRAAQFMFVFIGIETPDPEVLMQTQKSQNTMGSIASRVNILHDHGIIVMAGFIIGFDTEKPGVGKAMIALIEETNICMATVGLLVALPNTQLTRRLRKEGRLMSLDSNSNEAGQSLDVKDHTDFLEVVDHTTAGLNFVTLRPRNDILDEFANVVATIYDPKVYADRVLRLAQTITIKKRRYFPTVGQWLRQGRALWRLSLWISKIKVTRRYYWRNFFKALPLGMDKFEVASRMMGMFLHLEKQTQYIVQNMDNVKDFGKQIDLAHMRSQQLKIRQENAEIAKNQHPEVDVSKNQLPSRTQTTG